MNRERMLTIISEHPEGIRQKDLAEAAGINASSASEVVSRLEDDGYLVRVIDENDKRATLLKLTEMGAVRAEEIRSERDSFLNEVNKQRRHIRLKADMPSVFYSLKGETRPMSVMIFSYSLRPSVSDAKALIPKTELPCR